MKRSLLIGLLLVGTVLAGRAGITFYQGTGVSGDNCQGLVQNPVIADGNPAYVIANTMTLSGLGPSFSGLTVTLSITGGNNNGLSAYLMGPGGTTVVLMNRPGYADGFGATGAGMNITLTDAHAAQGSIQNETSSSVLSGTYNAAGSLSDLTSGSANGAWTLYFADTILGGGNAAINGWSLDITAVPEPVNVALGIFGVVLLGSHFGRRYFKMGVNTYRTRRVPK